MESKYNIGDRVWTTQARYDREDVFRPALVTIEEIKTATNPHSEILGKKIEGETPHYKMEEGYSYWRVECEIFPTEEKASEASQEANSRINKRKQLGKEFELLLETGNHISDGIYDVTNIESLEIEDHKTAIKWIESHREFWVANAYETSYIILLAKEPKRLYRVSKEVNWVGSGFNYGSTNIIRNCPKDILILAQND